MSARTAQKGQKVMVQPINLIFRYLQNVRLGLSFVDAGQHDALRGLGPVAAQWPCLICIRGGDGGLVAREVSVVPLRNMLTQG